jgi:hypothetical protein
MVTANVQNVRIIGEVCVSIRHPDRVHFLLAHRTP